MESMETYTFKGGIYPDEHKEMSQGCPITPAFPSSKTVTIPVTMGGAPNQPVVKVGDVVAKGQVIASSQAFMSAPVHASVSGTVKKITTNLSTANTEVPCIVIQADDSENTAYMDVLDPFTCSKEDAVKRIKEAGITGMGGASFPTHVKLSPPPGTKIDYILLNAAECEPYLTVDERTMKENAAKVVDGLLIVQHIAGGKPVICLESNKAYLVKELSEAAEKAAAQIKDAPKIEVKIVKTKYPQGAEKNIITAITGREVPSGGLPASAGCIVCNVGTVCAISDAFREGKPLIERALTISGGGVSEPKNLLVPIGTLISDLIPACVSLKEGKTVKILSGGPMMGFAMMNAGFPVQKGTSGVLFLTDEETGLNESTPCIGCGRCVGVCPMRLTPVMMVRSVKAGDTKVSREYGLMDCIECGCCSYVCPADVKLVQVIRMGKALVRSEIAAAKAKAEAAKAAMEKKSENGGEK